eukprot:6602605-Prymnesium_polylepis.1
MRRHHNPLPRPVAEVGAITELGGPEGVLRGTAASACHNMCFAHEMTRSGTLPFLVRVLKCVQRV